MKNVLILWGDWVADNKKYYYLKLKENFFDTDEMIILESMPDGYLYSNILLKLYLRSLKNEGKLMFNDRIPFNATMLAQVTRHSMGVVEKAMSIFNNLDLIEVLDNGAIYISDIQNFIGESSTEADRIRDYRKRIEEEKAIENEGCTNVQKKSVQMYDKSTPELEIEIDIEKEIKESRGKKRTVFTPPTLDQVKEYCTERKNGVDAERFIDFYSCKGWMVGKNKMKDWKAAVRTWERGDYNGRSGTSEKPKESDNSKYNGMVL